MDKNLTNTSIIFLSDSKKSPTNIPYRIKKSLIQFENKLNIYFFSFNIKEIANFLKIIYKLILKNKKIIIHSHHLKSLILNYILKIISLLFKKNKLLFSYHTFHCELIRYSKFKKILIYQTKFLIDKYSCVSSNIKVNWEYFLKKEVTFFPIGITKKEKNLIYKKSIFKNKKENYLNKKDKILNIVWIGRFEKVKNPLLLLKALGKLNISKDYKLKVIFVGNGKLLPVFKKELSSFYNLNLTNIEINYLGLQEREKVLNIISYTNLYINTSFSESFCVAANEFLNNPFCKLIMPDTENIKEIYKCERVEFYKVNNAISLSKAITINVNNFFENNFLKHANTFPREFDNYNLEATAKNLYNDYLATINNYR